MREDPRLKVFPVRFSEWLAVFVLGMSLFLVSCSGFREQPPTPPSDIVPSLPAPGTTTGEALPNTSTALNELYEAWQSGEPVGQLGETMGLEVSEERVLITLVMLDNAAAQRAVETLPEMGAEVSSSFETMIDAWVPVSALPQVASLPGISLVREVLPAYPVQPN